MSHAWAIGQAEYAKQFGGAPAFSAQWDSHIPVLMVSRFRDNLLRMHAIQFDMGLQDRLVPPSQIMALDTAFVHAAVPHVFETYAGGHVDRVRERLATRVFPFFSRVLVFQAKE